MSKDPKADDQIPLRYGTAANDNGPPESAAKSPWARPMEDAPPLPAQPSDGPRFPVVLTDWPERLPVLQAESDLIVAYISDLIGEIIANDNNEN